QLHGLWHAARRHHAKYRGGTGRGAVQDQSARSEGHRRIRHHRRPAHRHQCAARRAQAARRRCDRYAGNPDARVAKHYPREGRGCIGGNLARSEYYARMLTGLWGRPTHADASELVTANRLLEKLTECCWYAIDLSQSLII